MTVGTILVQCNRGQAVRLAKEVSFPRACRMRLSSWPRTAPDPRDGVGRGWGEAAQTVSGFAAGASSAASPSITRVWSPGVNVRWSATRRRRAA